MTSGRAHRSCGSARRQKARGAPAPSAQAEATPGWQSLVLRTRHGVDRDCTVLDARNDQVLYVASGFFLRSKAEVRRHGRDGEKVYVLRGRALDLPMEIVIRQPDGKRAAGVRATWRAPLASPIKVRLANGTEWGTTGSLAKREYSLVSDGKPMVEVAQKQVQIRTPAGSRSPTMSIRPWPRRSSGRSTSCSGTDLSGG